MSRLAILFCFSFLSFPLLSQRIENVRAEVLNEGERVVITYDIAGASEGQKFKVTVYASHNNYATPLSLVSGDVGRDRDLPGGANKRIEWSAKSELKDFSGDITFEVRADIISSFFIESPSLGSRFKKGKTLNVSWRGGSTGENIRLDLMKGGAVISQIASTLNSQSFSWTIPKNMSKAKDYQIRLTAESGTAMSGNFGIKPKTSFALIALPTLAVGGLAYLLLKPKPEKDDLPEPPLPE